jgi:hypothetical protein
LFDLSSHHSCRRASNDNLVRGSTPDSSTRDSTSRDDGRPTRLNNYLLGASPLSEDREAWISELIFSPENFRGHTTGVPGDLMAAVNNFREIGLAVYDGYRVEDFAVVVRL